MTKWQKVKLGDVCNILNGYAFQSEQYKNDGYRVIRITNVQKGRIVDDEPKFYPPSKTLNKFEFGYAITVHSSQSGGWDSVLFMYEGFLRNPKDKQRFLYTGITRAISQVIVVI
jgi:ATP-dependent exoDNAse (exonuclease V) alpha subunit